MENIKIVIIDDEQDFAETLAESLSVNLKCSTTLFLDIDSAMSYITKNKPDIILSDVFMPTGSGLRLTTDLEKNSLKIPVIYITGMIDKLPNKENVKMLRKPVDTKILIQTIQSLI